MTEQSTTEQAQCPPKWEYRFSVKQTERHLIMDLNEAGREGWEAISISYNRDLKGVWMWNAWFKRPVGPWSNGPTGVASGATGADGQAAPQGPWKGFDLSDGDFDFKDEASPAPAPQPEQPEPAPEEPNPEG
jgi:hypothetical protein